MSFQEYYIKIKKEACRCTIDDAVLIDRFEDFICKANLSVMYKRYKKLVGCDLSKDQFYRDIKAIKRKLVNVMNDLKVFKKEDFDNVVRIHNEEDQQKEQR